MGISIWTEERVAAFQKYCDQKIFSYKEIAQRLSTDFGISFTRNMLIGKAGRMGIVSQITPSTTARSNNIAAKRVRKPRLIKTGNGHYAKRKIETVEWKLRAVEIVCETSFEDVVGCRYPVGDGPFLFCNGKQQDGSSFCTAHHALCWEKPKSRRDVARAAA